MKSILAYLVILISLSGNGIQQKDSWTLMLDQKKIHEGIERGFNQGIPTVTLQSSQIRNSKFLEIIYKEAPTNIEWKRSFLFCDNDNQVVARSDFNKGDGVFSIPVSFFGTSLRKSRRLSLFAEQSPQNTDIMIRSKRISICELELN